ncbi:LPD38 domain-containing protein [Paenibacillus sp. FSL R5-0490]|uniref:LPD38 domain-containing protein n=1 Tax=Paenibacillus sp. FSL R5-0490 TaxID=1920424 RepID=UPI0030CF5CEF
MSLYDEYRKQRNLSSKFPASTGGTDTKEVSVYDQYRMAKGYKTDMNKLKSSLPPALTQQGPDRYMNSTLGRALGGDQKDFDLYQRATGVDLTAPPAPSDIYGPPAPTLYNRNKSKIAASRPEGFLGALYDASIGGTANGLNELLLGNSVGSFLSRSVSTPGQMIAGPRPYEVSTGNKKADLVADIAGYVGAVPLAGFNPSGGANLITAPWKAANVALATRAGNNLTNMVGSGVNKILPRINPSTANKVAETALRGAATGAISNPMFGLIQGQNSNSDVLRNAALGAGLGAGGDLLVAGIGVGLRNALTKLKGNNGVRQAEEILALPLGRGDERLSAAQRRGQTATGNDPIVNPSNWTPEPLGLPAGQLAAPTTGRLAQVGNVYRQKFENLMRVANETQFTPGREAEELEGLWASMADRSDPGLSELIDRAYATTKREITPDLMQRARANQAQRDVYGVPLPVKSLEDRMPRPTIADDAKVTQERLTFDRQARSGEAEVINPGGTGSVNSRTESARRYQAEQGQMPAAETTSASDGFLSSRPGRMAESAPAQRVPETTSTLEPDVPLNYQEDYQSAANATKQNWFTNLFGNQGVGISPFGTNRRQGVNPISTEDQIVGNRIRRDAQGTIEEGKAAARSAYQNAVDYLSPLKKISKKAYEQSIDASRANNIANTIIKDKFVDPQGRIVGESLQEIFNKVPRGQSKRFVDFLIKRHAVTRMSRGERVYAENLQMTPQKIKKQMEQMVSRNPEFEDIAKDWDRFNENLLKVYGVDEGLISPQLFNSLRESNPNYAPMQRQFKLSEKFSQPFTMKQGNAFSGQKAPIKEVSATGSVRNIVDPRRTIIESTGAWVNASLRNRVMQSLVDAVRREPDAFKGVAEIVQAPKGQPNLKQVLSEGDQMDFMNMLNDDFNKLFNRTRLDQDNVIRAMYKGEPVYLQIHDPEAVKALSGMGTETSNVVLDAIGKLSTATKYSATGPFAPMFAVKGFFMDTPQALIQSKNPAMHMVDLGHALISSIADSLPKGTPGVESIRSLAQEYRRVGGGYSAILRGDRGLKKGVSQLNRDPLLSPQNVAKTAGKAVASPFKALSKFGDMGENLNRMAGYQGELRRRGFDRTPENITAALNESREITTNFSRRGNLSTQVEKFVPYSNAAMQGLRRFAVQWKKNPVKTMLLVGGTILLPKALELMSHYDDPDYRKIPAREKYRNLILGKTEDGKFNKVPIPMEYGAMGGLFADILESVYLDNPQAFKGSAEAMVNAFLPPQLSGVAAPLARGEGLGEMIVGGVNSTVLSPFMAVGANVDYAGRPIESRALEGNSPVNRYDERTSQVAIELANYLKMSPKKIDYLIRSYGGDPARLLLPLTSQAGQGDIKGTLLKNFIVDPEYTNTLSTDYYLYKERFEQAAKDYKDEKANLPKWYNESLKEVISTTKKGSYNKRLSDLSKQKREVQADNTLTPKKKTEKLRELQFQVNDIYMTVNQMMEEAGIPLR